MTFLIGAAIATSLAGCAVEPADQKIWNRTDASVQVFMVRNGKETLRAVIAPNSFYPLNDGEDCPTLDLVARTMAGAEIERWTGPFCRANEWMIDDSNQATGIPSLSPASTPTPVPT